MIKLLILLITLLILSCEQEMSYTPLTIYRDYDSSTQIYVYAKPDSVDRRITISNYTTGEIVDSFTIPSGIQWAISDTIQEGHYTITAESDSLWSDVKSHYVYGSQEWWANLFLSDTPYLFNKVHSESNESPLRDTEIRLIFKDYFESALLSELITISPEVPFRYSGLDKDRDNYFGLVISPSFMRYQDSITVILNDSVQSLNGYQFERPYEITYHFDTTKYGSLIFNYYIEEFYPKRYFESYISGARSPYYVQYKPCKTDEDIWIHFENPVLASTIEKSFTITPSISGTFLYDSLVTDSFRFVPDTHLQSGNLYTVSISTDLCLADSSAIEDTLSWNFSTEVFRYDSRYTDMMNSDSSAYEMVYLIEVTPKEPLSFPFSSSIDSLSFVKGFSCEPPLDSMEITFSEERDTVFVHTDLDSSIEYQVTLDTVITDLYGSPLPYQYEITVSMDDSL